MSRRGIAVALALAAVMVAALFALRATVTDSGEEPGPAAAQPHSRTGYYQGMGAVGPRTSPVPSGVHLDKAGLPVVDYPQGFSARNPVTLEQFGLLAYGRSIQHDDRSLLPLVRRHADWLARNQRADGTWRFGFPWEVESAGGLEAGWSSALAQAQGISLLRRVHHFTGDARYRRAALRALGPLTRPPLRRSYRGGVWFEEYPTRRPSYVLNGHIQTLLALYDIADWSPEARRLYGEGRATLRRVLPAADVNGRSRYALVDRSDGTDWLTTPDYHLAHVRLLRTLDRLEPDPVFREWADRWDDSEHAGS